MRALAVGVAILTASTAAPAAPIDCRSITDPVKRLACFDAETAAAPAPAPNADWEVEETKSPLDDTAEFMAAVKATEGKGMFGLRCRERRTDAFILVQYTFLGSGTGPNIKVTYRLNQAPPVEAHWPPSTQGTGVFIPSPIPFLRQIPEGAKLFVRLHDFRGVPHDNAFDLSGISAHRDRLATICKWPTPKAAPAKKSP